MRFALRISALMLVAAAALPQQSQAMSQPAQRTVTASPVGKASAPSVPAAPLALSVVSLLAFSVMGTTRDLDKTYLFGGLRYGPGKDIEVPDDFPDLDDDGNVIHKAGSQAERNQKRSRMFASPPSTGGVNTGVPAGSVSADSTNTVSGMSRTELQGMTVEELTEAAGDAGIDVVRGDGKEGDPLKADYIEALSKPTA